MGAKANEKKQKTGPPSGKLKDHCIDAAKKGIQDVIKEVKNSQAMLDALDNGASCTTDKCRCAAATVALKEFRVATAMDAARKAAVVRDTKVICITKASGDKRKVAACHRMTINDITMAKYKPQLKLRPATMASGVSVRACKATIKPTIKPVAPADPCKKWKAEYKANAEIAKALKAEVRFGGGSTKLKDQGKKTLDNVAKILNKYPWMTITVEGHSDAPKGARCTALTVGRAAETEKYLKSKGVKNKMTRPIGKCGKKRAIEIIGNAAGRKAPPKGCNKAEFDEEDYGMQLLQKTNAAAQCRDPSFKANLLKSRSVKKKLTITKTKLVSSVKTAVCGSKENKQKEAANKERTNKEKSSKEKRTKESSSKEGGSKEGTNKEKKAKEVRTKAKLETVNKEKKSKELRSKEQRIKEKSAKDEKKNKELRGKERKSKEKKSKENTAKIEKTKKEKSNKEGKKKELKKKEVTLKEASTKREKASKERRSKELKNKEKSNKEKKSKERKNKESSAKERRGKEGKAKEVASKERANKERGTKEKKGKEVNAKKEKAAKEKLPKERKSKELSSKETRGKESKAKERRNKEK